MKKLIFIRHGKAEDPVSEITDYERSLTIKGKIISRNMAKILREIEIHSDIMITSPAFRALETAFIFADEFDIKPEKILIHSDLYYNMNLQSLNKLLSQISEDTDTIFLFGHNPSFTDIPNKICSKGSDFLPKSGIVGISLNIKLWTDIGINTGKMEYFLKPEKA